MNKGVVEEPLRRNSANKRVGQKGKEEPGSRNMGCFQLEREKKKKMRRTER